MRAASPSKFRGVGFRHIERRQTIAALAGRGFFKKQRFVLRKVRSNLLAIAGEAVSLFCCVGHSSHPLLLCVNQRGLAAVAAGEDLRGTVDLFASGELGGAPQTGVAQLRVEAL